MTSKLVVGILMTAIEFCTGLIVTPTPMMSCVEEVSECMLDGESIEWCSRDYLKITDDVHPEEVFKRD